jgi:hypothetical protein
VDVSEERAQAHFLCHHLGRGEGCAQDDESPRHADEVAEEGGAELRSQVLEDVERDDDVEALGAKGERAGVSLDEGPPRSRLVAASTSR